MKSVIDKMQETNAKSKIKNLVVEKCKCDICEAEGKLILREGKHFKYWFCECPNGHRPGIKKIIDDIFQIGDRVRIYDVPFGINSKIDFTNYKEGFVVSKEKSITCYSLAVKIDKVVHDNEDVKKTSFLYKRTIRGIQSDSDSLELLTPQMKFELKEMVINE